MFVITDKADVIVMFSRAANQIDDNGKYMMLDASIIQSDQFNVYEVSDISGMVIGQKCFDGTKIYDNPNYTGDQFQQKIDALRAQINHKNPDEIFLSLDVDNTSLDDLKTKKVDQLNYLCNKTILGGFASNALGEDHQYQSGTDDQINTIGTLTLLNSDPTVTTIVFKTVDSGFLVHTREQFLQLYKDGEDFKRSNIIKYNQLKSDVLTKTTKEEVLALVW